MVGMTDTDRTTAAEARFVEEGHRAFLAHDHVGHHIRVISETLGQRGVHYKVRVAASGPGLPLVITCAPSGHVGRDGHREISRTDGVPPCKHAAGACRRLGREGLAVPVLPGIHGAIVTRDTRWVAAEVEGIGQAFGDMIRAGAADEPAEDEHRIDAVTDDVFAAFRAVPDGRSR